MSPDPQVLARLNQEQQYVFLPYYRAIVARHPEGIASVRVKQLVASQIRDEFDLDVLDPNVTGLHPSTGRSRAERWANNLVSNKVLDDYMLVVRGGRAMLYPGAEDNSRTLAPLAESLTLDQVDEPNHRKPIRAEAQAGSTFRRSLQLAEHVCDLNHRVCVVGRPTCVVFNARDGRQYVEVHHVVPMVMQGGTEINLDRSSNTVPLCPGCHACLHRGHIDAAASRLGDVFAWFESKEHARPIISRGQRGSWL